MSKMKYYDCIPEKIAGCDVINTPKYTQKCHCFCKKERETLNDNQFMRLFQIFLPSHVIFLYRNKMTNILVFSRCYVFIIWFILMAFLPKFRNNKILDIAL